MSEPTGDHVGPVDSIARLITIVDELWDHMRVDTPLEELTTADISALVHTAASSVQSAGFDTSDPEVEHPLVALWMHGFLAGEKWGTP